MRALIAARLSRKQKGGDEGIGLDTQDERSREFVDRMGWELAGVARDTISGTKAPIDRKDLGKWISDPDLRATYDCIVAFKSDRFSRGEDVDWSRIESWAADHGKVLVMVDSGTGVRYPARDDSDFWQWSAAKRQAGQELASIKERIGRAHTAIRANGGLIGKAPFGYAIAGARYAKYLIMCEREADIIRWAAGQYLKDATLDVICYALNDARRLTRSGAQWSPKTLSQVLRSENAIGRIVRYGTVIKAEPILDRKTWQAVADRMDGRAHRKGITQSGQPALLTSLIFCAKCLGPMYRIKSGYGAAQRDAYYCRHCPKGQRPMVTCTLADELAEMYLLERYGASLRTQTAIIPGHNHDDAIADVKADMGVALKAEDFSRITELKAELDRLRSLPSVPDRPVQVPVRDAEGNETTVARHWAASDVAARRKMLTGLLNAYVFEGGRTEFTSGGMSPREAVATLTAA
jgi:DNA invertase Pin-like site-specific DNA recombinase